MNFSETDKFAKNFKRLSKKYRSLPEDLLEFKRIVSEIPLGSGKHCVVLHENEEVKILKARLFCKYLRGASLRIIYAYRESIKTIDCIELYFKGEQVNEDRSRIKDFLNFDAAALLPIRTGLKKVREERSAGKAVAPHTEIFLYTGPKSKTLIERKS